MMGLIGAGNNPMVGMTVACAVAIEESSLNAFKAEVDKVSVLGHMTEKL